MKQPARSARKPAQAPDRSPQTRDFLASLILLMNAITRKRMNGGLPPSVVQLLTQVNAAVVSDRESDRDEMEEEITAALVKELYDAREAAVPTAATTADVWARRMRDSWFADPPHERDLSPIITLAAMWVYANSPTDPDSWNDRFALAVLCGLPFERRQEAAWCAVSNGLLGYWQPLTHDGVRMAEVLQTFGVTQRFDTSQKSEGPGYVWLHDETIAAIARQFRLPTRRAGYEHFTLDQQRLREYLTRSYPRHSPL
jgi:hypothetical protein